MIYIPFNSFILNSKNGRRRRRGKRKSVCVSIFTFRFGNKASGQGGYRGNLLLIWTLSNYRFSGCRKNCSFFSLAFPFSPCLLLVRAHREVSLCLDVYYWYSCAAALSIGVERHDLIYPPEPTLRPFFYICLFGPPDPEARKQKRNRARNENIKFLST